MHDVISDYFLPRILSPLLQSEFVYPIREQSQRLNNPAKSRFSQTYNISIMFALLAHLRFSLHLSFAPFKTLSSRADQESPIDSWARRASELKQWSLSGDVEWKTLGFMAVITHSFIPFPLPRYKHMQMGHKLYSSGAKIRASFRQIDWYSVIINSSQKNENRLNCSLRERMAN